LNIDRAPPLKRSVRRYSLMEVIDYNGTDFWSVDEVRARYTKYARRFRITEPRKLSPLVHSNGDKQWIYSVMDAVIEGIERRPSVCRTGN
jgi:hypothetical protein